MRFIKLMTYVSSFCLLAATSSTLAATHKKAEQHPSSIALKKTVKKLNHKNLVKQNRKAAVKKSEKKISSSESPTQSNKKSEKKKSVAVKKTHAIEHPKQVENEKNPPSVVNKNAQSVKKSQSPESKNIKSASENIKTEAKKTISEKKEGETPKNIPDKKEGEKVSVTPPANENGKPIFGFGTQSPTVIGFAPSKITQASTASVPLIANSHNATPITRPTIQNNIWPQISAHFILQSNANNDLVRQRIAWYLAHKQDLQQSLAQARPYLFHLFNETNHRNLPAEIVLIPLVKSGFDPMTIDNPDTAGIWELSTEHAANLGIKMNWWYDGRKDFLTSTTAVLNNIAQLHETYPDWLLTLAAYQAGAQTVRAAMQENLQQHKNVDFWSLNLPSKTQVFVANIIALTQIIRYPDYYNLNLADIDPTPYFGVAQLRQQMDLGEISQFAQMPVEEIQLLNPGISQWATDPNENILLLLPINKVNNFKIAIAGSQQRKPQWERYKVKDKDTIEKIALMHHIQVDKLKQINPIMQPPIKVGSSVLVPTVPKNDYNLPDPNIIIPIHNSNVQNTEDDSLKSILGKVYQNKGV